MNSAESASPEQKSAQKDEWETVLLDAESREVLEELKQELKILVDCLNAPETGKLEFGAPGGEQEIGGKIVALQNEKVPKVFGNTEFESPHLRVHNLQTEQYSCQLATTANVLEALGVSVTEKEIAEAIGKEGKTANIWPEELSAYLGEKGLEISRISSALEAIDALIKGKKIILPLLPPKYRVPHTVAISGIKIRNGKIEFYINDPQYQNYAETVSLNDITDTMIPYSFHKIAPPYAVSRRGFEEKAAGDRP